MTAPAADTRSIGQVLYEKLNPGLRSWQSVGRSERDAYERAAEVLFKRGFDACRKEEKSLTPKAKAYRDALREAVETLNDLCKYAVEDRAVTPGTTRLARGVIRARAIITKAEPVLK